MNHQCEYKIKTGDYIYTVRRCTRTNTQKHSNGKWYCWQHNPDRIERKHKEREDKWEREYKERQKQREYQDKVDLDTKTLVNMIKPIVDILGIPTSLLEEETQDNVRRKIRKHLSEAENLISKIHRLEYLKNEH